MSHVVIIDDSVVVRKIVEATLRRAGITCYCYEDGIEALQALREKQQDIPDVILLDIGLPGIDGYDVLRLLRTSPRYEHTAIVMLSARDGVLDRLKSRLAGARGYITKPFKIQDLLSVLQSA